MLQILKPKRIKITAYLPGLLCMVILVMVQPLAAQIPVMGAQSVLNLDQERRLGLRVYRSLLAGDHIETHPLIDGYINDLGDRLLDGLDNSSRDYQFFVVRNDTINAFALPGGFIGINRGLILKAASVDQVASVLAHEIAHVELRHGMQMMEKGRQVSNSTTMAMLAGILLGVANPTVGAAAVYGGAAAGQQEMINYTRENEYEADRIGVGLLQSAGFDAQGMVEFFQIMQSMSQNSGASTIEYLRTHPIDSNRISEAQGRVAFAPAATVHIDDFELFQSFLRYSGTAKPPEPQDDFTEALWQLRVGKTGEALASIEPLYAANPENLWFSAVYTEVLEQLQRYTDAAEVYQRQLTIYPEHYYLSVKLIRVLQQLGLFDQALELARVQERLRPDNRTVLFALSSIYQALGKPWLSKFSQAEYQRLAGNDHQAARLYDEILQSGDADQATELRAREQRALLKK